MDDKTYFKQLKPYDWEIVLHKAEYMEIYKFDYLEREGGVLRIDYNNDQTIFTTLPFTIRKREK